LGLCAFVAGCFLPYKYNGPFASSLFLDTEIFFVGKIAAFFVILLWIIAMFTVHRSSRGSNEDVDVVTRWKLNNLLGSNCMFMWIVIALLGIWGGAFRNMTRDFLPGLPCLIGSEIFCIILTIRTRVTHRERLENRAAIFQRRANAFNAMMGTIQHNNATVMPVAIAQAIPQSIPAEPLHGIAQPIPHVPLQSGPLPLAGNAAVPVAQASIPVAHQTSHRSLTDELQKLFDLKNSGALTDAEYQTAKQRIISSHQSPGA